jgi:hypothetical protein
MTSILRLRRGIVQSLARGASLRSVEANPKVGRGGGWLVWLVYGGRGLRGRWHGFSGQTPANSGSGWVRDARGCTVDIEVGFIAAGAGVGAELARRGAAPAG